jgi:hypothetical protein
VPCVPAGDEGAPLTVTAQLAGLTAGSSVYFRIVASNAGGTVYGEAGAFSTLPAETPSSTTPTPLVPLTSTITPPTGRIELLAAVERRPAAPRAILTGTSLSLGAHGTLAAHVSCPPLASSCAGTVTVRTLHAVIAGRRAAILVLAIGSFDIPGGRVAAVRLALSAAARSMLRRGGVLRGRATVLAHDGYGDRQTTSATVTIRPARG